MKKIAAFVVLFLFISSQVDVARSDANCHDDCTRECCGGDLTKIDSCDHVCTVKCDPGFSSAAGTMGLK